MLFRPKKPLESRSKTVLGYLAVFFVSAAVCTIIQARPSFRDPDSFYHLKMAQLMLGQGIIHEFRWLPFTTLSDDFADHHFLYHLLLTPFISVLGPLYGMITASVIFASLALILFYALLRAYGVRWPAAYVYILGTGGSFIFRLNLAKASALSLAVIFAALIAIKKDKPWLLFLIAWIYVLLYGGWPLLLIIVGVSVLAKMITDRLTERHPWHSWSHRWFWRRLFGGSKHAVGDFIETPEARAVGATVAGLMAGLVFNPYFPQNIRFYWEQIVQIAIVGYRDRIGVGSEWYPFAPDLLVRSTGGSFLLVLIALALLAFVLFWPEIIINKEKTLTNKEVAPLVSAWLMALIFLVLTLRSKRHVEYLVPFVTLAGAMLINIIWTRLDIVKGRQRLAELLPKFRHAVTLFLCWFAAVFLYVGIKDVLLTRDLYAEGESYDKYSGAAAWLAKRAPEGAIIFHSDWDDFPMLFFQDDKRRYVAGLDPTFLYRKDPERYRIWTGITTGRIDDGVARIVAEKFGSHYVFVENDHAAMRQSFESDPGAVLMYRDAEASIFVIL